MGSTNLELPSHNETAGPSNSGANVVEPIFLSHSGCQKAFVEQLYDALMSANHSAFFDKHTLPKGSPFPSRIKQAALGCKLGVVVISDDFLMSKWPMIELDILIKQRGPDPMVLPLFYKLHPKDLKSTSNLAKWRSVWKEKAHEHADRWEEAVQMLDSFNGEVFIGGSSETAYIQKVVHRICNLVPCRVPYDISWVQGHERLAEEIAGIFKRVKARCSEELACIVGLHGIGGLGKTTLCKCMVNFYTTQYPGRSCLIEFPSDGDKVKIVQECKSALKKLTNLSMERLSNEADSFDQVIHLMREHVKRYDVFLAIDNVWEHCREEAERLLGVGFSAKSQVLVTSRSKKVLRDLLLQHTNMSLVVPLPAPEHEEAFQIFQKTFKLGDLRCLVDRNEMGRALERCKFSGTYHSLALKALAQYVQRVCELESLENVKHRLPVILKEISNADLQTVEEVIRFSYDIMPEKKKNMFLDIVILAIIQDTVRVCSEQRTSANFFRRNIRDIRIFSEWRAYAEAHRWLCVLYKEFRETNITELMSELASDGLIQIGVDEDGEKTLEVHDLFLDLAQREVATSPRFFTEESTRSVTEMEWERLERVVLRWDKDECFFTKLQEEGCRKLQVLCADGIHMRGGIRLGVKMPSLCVLSLRNMKVTSTRWRMSRVLRLNGLVQLQVLELVRCVVVERIGGLRALQNLQRLRIKECPGLKKLDGLSGLSRLEYLSVRDCESMKKMQDLSTALKVVKVKVCNALRKIEDLGGLPRLEKLYLFGNTAMEEVGGESFSASLKEFSAWGEGRGLRRFPSLNYCVHLQRLRIVNEQAIVDGLVLEKLANLQDLQLVSINLFNELQWEHLAFLQRLHVSDLGSIKKLEVGCLIRLAHLEVWRCEALEEIGDFSALHRLESLEIFRCPRLKKVIGLEGILTHLKHLELWNCGLLEASTIPDMSLLNSIESSMIRGCDNLEDWNY